MDPFYNVGQYQAGDIVYVFYRNPHTQDVANVQEAAIVKNPSNPTELALFLYETYFPLTEDIDIFPTKEEAERAYDYFFNGVEGEKFDG
ncbi:transcriptional regulator SplA domain-containing protein [Fervidibacillus albus]|uniref:Transcriptional regulator n=1 Tax=Fervidibacillus albus TaxID=2980026 RepID=A0A9E8LWC7_9BACI|nr:transcriptional regulator SplA domain-containing protein [Fervidibacillus albus]WAA10789.1 transcriptional regulator [Fervidibacillus albus]